VRIDNDPKNAKGDGYQYEGEIIIGGNGREVHLEEKEVEIRPGDIYETVCSTGEPIPLPNYGVDHHAKGQGEHGEIDLVQTDTKIPDDPSGNGGCDDPGDESQRYGRIDME
jgi:hypothetical protein